MAEVAPAPGRGEARGERDLRLDFFRGLSLFFIFIDHVPGNLLAYATFHALAFSDAARRSSPSRASQSAWRICAFSMMLRSSVAR